MMIMMMMIIIIIIVMTRSSFLLGTVNCVSTTQRSSETQHFT